VRAKKPQPERLWQWRLGRIEGLCLGCEKRSHVGDFRESAGFEVGLDLGEHVAEFSRELGGNCLENSTFLADDVVNGLGRELELVKARAVVEEAAANQAQFLEGGETAINSDEVAGAVFEIEVDLFDRGGFVAFDQSIEDRNTGLGDTQACGLKTAACLLQSAAGGLAGSGIIGHGMIGLSG
jgi:hypothetical protein